MLYYGTLLKIYCKESMYSMLEVKLQNCPLTISNKYVYNGKSEIKVKIYIHFYLQKWIYIYIFTFAYVYIHTFLCDSADAET